MLHVHCIPSRVQRGCVEQREQLPPLSAAYYCLCVCVLCVCVCVCVRVTLPSILICTIREAYCAQSVYTG